MPIVTDEPRTIYPPGLAYAVSQEVWTKVTLSKLQECASIHDLCSDCQFKKRCRKVYDTLLDRLDDEGLAQLKERYGHRS